MAIVIPASAMPPAGRIGLIGRPGGSRLDGRWESWDPRGRQYGAIIDLVSLSTLLEFVAGKGFFFFLKLLGGRTAAAN